MQIHLLTNAALLATPEFRADPMPQIPSSDLRIETIGTGAVLPLEALEERQLRRGAIRE